MSLSLKTLAAAIAAAIAATKAEPDPSRAAAAAVGAVTALPLSQEVYVDETYAMFIGKTVFIRTVTMTNVGVLQAVMKDGFLLSDAVWIANTGRWSQFCQNGTADEVEPFGSTPVVVAKGGVIDVGLMPKIPTSSK